jgi:hypothetical protein
MSASSKHGFELVTLKEQELPQQQHSLGPSHWGVEPSFEDFIRWIEPRDLT